MNQFDSRANGPVSLSLANLYGNQDNKPVATKLEVLDSLLESSGKRLQISLGGRYVRRADNVPVDLRQARDDVLEIFKNLIHVTQDRVKNCTLTLGKKEKSLKNQSEFKIKQSIDFIKNLNDQVKIIPDKALDGVGVELRRSHFIAFSDFSKQECAAMFRQLSNAEINEGCKIDEEIVESREKWVLNSDKLTPRRRHNISFNSQLTLSLQLLQLKNYSSTADSVLYIKRTTEHFLDEDKKHNILTDLERLKVKRFYQIYKNAVLVRGGRISDLQKQSIVADLTNQIKDIKKRSKCVLIPFSVENERGNRHSMMIHIKCVSEKGRGSNKHKILLTHYNSNGYRDETRVQFVASQELDERMVLKQTFNISSCLSMSGNEVSVSKVTHFVQHLVDLIDLKTSSFDGRLRHFVKKEGGNRVFDQKVELQTKQQISDCVSQVGKVLRRELLGETLFFKFERYNLLCARKELVCANLDSPDRLNNFIARYYLDDPPVKKREILMNFDQGVYDKARLGLLSTACLITEKEWVLARISDDQSQTLSAEVDKGKFQALREKYGLYEDYIDFDRFAASYNVALSKIIDDGIRENFKQRVVDLEVKLAKTRNQVVHHVVAMVDDEIKSFDDAVKKS